jgi:hypothetical protein
VHNSGVAFTLKKAGEAGVEVKTQAQNTTVDNIRYDHRYCTCTVYSVQLHQDCPCGAARHFSSELIHILLLKIIIVSNIS